MMSIWTDLWNLFFPHNRNITYTGVGENPSLIQGLDKERTVQNVTFENVVINGERMKDLKGVVTNEFIKGIKIK